MKWMGDLPIRKKLTRVILLTCTVVLLFASVVLVGYELFDFRRAMARDMSVLGDILARNSQAAMMFDDDQGARETLSALEAESSVRLAVLYRPDGRVFASYRRAGSPAVPPSVTGPDGARFARDGLRLFRPVSIDGRRLGTLYLEAGLEGIYERLQLFGGIAAIVLAASLAVAFLLSSRLQRPISEPILALAQTAHDISGGKDYSVRAPSQGANEIGVLTESFNQMLDGIEARERALRSANLSLEAEVEERQSAEERARAQLARLELLNHITRAIGERQDLQSIFQVVIGSLEERLPVDFTCMGVYDAAEECFKVTSLGGRSQDLSARVRLPAGTLIPVAVNSLGRLMEGRLVYEPHLELTAVPLLKDLMAGGLQSLVVAPLMVEKKAFAALFAARQKPDAFSSGECEFLKQLSEHAALAAHQAELHGALLQAYEDLRQTQAAVMQQERLRALGQMASGIAHDINNALSPVALYTESLLENEPNLSPRARDYLTTIQHAVDDVAQTVARMREFYRQREPNQALVSVQLNRLAQQVLDLSRARITAMPQQQGVVIKPTVDLRPDLPEILGVESEIREALINLIFNAVDAMPGGGRLTVRTGVIQDPDGKMRVKVEVADTGVGMSEETRKRCLEPFFTTKGERGTGLGLAMVYGVVQRHSAELELDSVVGIGTLARIVFPVPENAIAAPAAASVAPAIRDLRILVVDDDPLVMKALKDALAIDGHTVVPASGGQAGIDAFIESLRTERPFALVITDLGMPHVDGRKVAETIKSLSPSTPVVLLTGWGQRLVAEGTVPPHVDRVLNKPPRLPDLREAFRALCGPRVP